MRAPRLAVVLFAGTLLVSAGLVFLVQPLFARLVLPRLGGVPAVWTATVLLFQTALLAGYLYVHVLTRRLRVRAQLVVHGALVLVPLPLLPFAIPAAWSDPGAGAAVPWLVGLFVVTVAAPYFVVATTAPLLQRWLAGTPHPDAGDPYFLYVASNVGSLVGLLAYPFVLEPALPLADHALVWTAGYAVFAVLVLGSIVWRWRSDEARAPEPAAAVGPEPPPAPLGRLRQARWVVLAAVPVSLMLAVTTHLTTDVAPVPLLWVLPLTLYLVSFVLVFGRRWERRSLERASWGFAAGAVLLTLLVGLDRRDLLVGVALLHLAVLFLAAVTLHGRLAADRPEPRHLTRFYLWLAVGGALGGAFNTLVAPLVFTDLTEYPLMLVLAAFAVALPAIRVRSEPGRFTLHRTDAPPRRPAWHELAIGGIVVGAVTIALVVTGASAREELPYALVVLAGAVACAVLGLSGRPGRFAVVLGAVLLGLWLPSLGQGETVFRDRSFYGVKEVTAAESDSGRVHALSNGTTLHGNQIRTAAQAREPLSYYHRSGPMGQLLAGLPDRRVLRRSAVVGLGAGTMACHARAGERWTFFEIDPAVERMARDPSVFSYLRDCPGTHDVVLGDGRLSLADEPLGAYGLIVLDAFNSDAIPVHLLTTEAIATYRDRLAPGGVLAIHISNRYADLEPVVGDVAAALGLACRQQTDELVTERQLGKTESNWVVLARRGADLGRAGGAPWTSCATDPGAGAWTDERSDLLAVLLG